MRNIIFIFFILSFILGCGSSDYCESDCNKKCKAEVCRNVEKASYYTNMNINSISQYDIYDDFVSIGARWVNFRNWDKVTQSIITRDHSSVRVLKSDIVSRYFDVDTTLKYVINTENDLLTKVKYTHTEYVADVMESYFRHVYSFKGGPIDESLRNNLLLLNFIPNSTKGVVLSDKTKYNEVILEGGFVSTNGISYTEEPKMFHFEDDDKNIKLSFVSFYDDSGNISNNMGYFLEHTKSGIITHHDFERYVFDVIPLNFLINNKEAFLITVGYNYSDGVGTSIFYFDGRKYSQM